MCMCVTCIKKKIEESKENVIKQIMGTKNESNKRDPRINKETKNP